MLQVFDGDSANSVWKSIAETFLDEKNKVASQPSRAGQVHEILHAGISISNPRDRWVFARIPPINPAFALAEVVWIITGKNDASFLNHFNSKLPCYAGKEETYHGAYGHRLRRAFGIDQLDRAYHALRRNAASRQVVLQIWDATRDLPHMNGEAASPDIPCNVMSMLKVRENKLEWMQILRSNDLFLGVPYNIIQFTTLQEVMAGWLGLELGTYNQISDSLHVYAHQYPLLKKMDRSKAPRNNESLAFPKNESERYFALIAQHIEEIVKDKNCKLDLFKIAAAPALPPSFANILRVLCAESARRRKDGPMALKIISLCSNVVFKELFKRWLKSYPVKNKIDLQKTEQLVV